MRGANDVDVGYRVLIDRLWPRSVPKTDAEIDEWATEARATHDDRLRELRGRARKRRLTLVQSDPDEERDGAVVLELSRRDKQSPWRPSRSSQARPTGRTR